MNCSPTICIALLLLSLTAGMWLLYKTQKENLNTFFKVVAWFVIVVSFCSMICCTMRSVMHCAMKQQCKEMGMGGCEMGMGKGMCMKGGMEKHMMMMRGGECEMGGSKCCKEGREECEEGEGECMEGHEGKMDGCKKGKEKCDMKMMKDSVVVKK